MMMDNEMLLCEDIARLLHISANTVRRREWRMRTGIPMRRIGKRLYAMRSEVEKWIRTYDGKEAKI